MQNFSTEAEPLPASPKENTEAKPTKSTGQLIVNVFTANGLFPVPGADVSISDNNKASASSVTDRSGRTVVFTLDSPAASESLAPSEKKPFSVYTVTINHPDFFETIIENVQIFSDILTQLPANLIPLPELLKEKRAKTVYIPNQNL